MVFPTAWLQIISELWCLPCLMVVSLQRRQRLRPPQDFTQAARHGRLLGFLEPFLWKLVDTVVGIMGYHYTELQAEAIS